MELQDLQGKGTGGWSPLHIRDHVDRLSRLVTVGACHRHTDG